MDILKRIDELRNKKGWTIFKLAEESGVNQSTLANMYSRGTLPSLTTLNSLCEAFNITMSQFFAESEIDIKDSNNINLVQKFNLLSKKEQQAVLNLIEKLAD